MFTVTRTLPKANARSWLQSQGLDVVLPRGGRRGSDYWSHRLRVCVSKMLQVEMNLELEASAFTALPQIQLKQMYREGYQRSTEKQDDT